MSTVESEKLIRWIKDTSRSTVAQNPTDLALRITDILNRKGKTERMQSMVDILPTIVDVPQVETSSLRYKAAVALSCYLKEDQKS